MHVKEQNASVQNTCGRNDSKRNFNYRVQMLVGANRKPKADPKIPKGSKYPSSRYLGPENIYDNST